MCGSEQNWVVGGLIVAAAMLVSAFASQGDTAGAHRQQHEPPAHSQSAGSDLMVSLDPLALSVRSGNFTLEVTV